MAAQTSYSEQLAAYAGLRYGMSTHRANSAVNDAGSTKQIHDVVVTSAANSTVYTFTITEVLTGVVTTIVITTPASGNTVTTVRDSLIAYLRTLQSLEGVVTANPVSTDTIRVTAQRAGYGFTLAESDGNLTNSAIQANVAPEYLFFGRGVVKRSAGGDRSVTAPSAAADRALFRGVLEREHQIVDPINPSRPQASPGQNLTIIKAGGVWVEVDEAITEGARAYCRFATGGTGSGAIGTFKDNPGGTAHVMRITVSGTITNSGTYRVIVNGRVIEVTADGSATIDEMVTLLTNAITAQGLSVTAVGDLANDWVTLTANNPGEPITFTELTDLATNFAVTEVTANVAGVAFSINGVFESSTTGAGLAKLMLNEPQPGANP